MQYVENKTTNRENIESTVVVYDEITKQQRNLIGGFMHVTCRTGGFGNNRLVIKYECSYVSYL